LVLFLLCAVVLLRNAKHSKARFVALAGLVSAILVPYGMLAAGRYAFYYAWMGAVPVAIAFAITLEQSWVGSRRLLLTGGVVAGIVSVYLGMPSEVWQQFHQTDPGTYAAVELMVQQETQLGDAVYGDPAMYYAVKQLNIPFFSTSYAGGRGYPRMTDEERARISTLILAPAQIPESIEKLGGEWKQKLTYQLPYGPLVVYKRTSLCKPSNH
jgi:hypothetical protein